MLTSNYNNGKLTIRKSIAPRDTILMIYAGGYVGVVLASLFLGSNLIVPAFVLWAFGAVLWYVYARRQLELTLDAADRTLIVRNHPSTGRDFEILFLDDMKSPFRLGTSGTALNPVHFIEADFGEGLPRRFFEDSGIIDDSFQEKVVEMNQLRVLLPPEQ